MPNEKLPDIEQRKIAIFPGFTWDSKESAGPLRQELQAQMSVDDGGIVVMGYFDHRLSTHSKVTLTDNEGNLHDLRPKNRTEALAYNALQQIENSQLQNEPLNIVAHSYGALIADRARQLSEKLGWTCFVPEQNANGEQNSTREYVFIDPTGTLESDNMLKITGRYLGNFLGLVRRNFRQKAVRNQLMRLVSEPVHRLREAVELGRDKVDYADLAMSGIHTHILAHRADKVIVEDGLNDVFDDSFETENAIRVAYIGDEKADHSDILTNPHRNAIVVNQMLRPYDFRGREVRSDDSQKIS